MNSTGKSFGAHQFEVIADSVSLNHTGKMKTYADIIASKQERCGFGSTSTYKSKGEPTSNGYLHFIEHNGCTSDTYRKEYESFMNEIKGPNPIMFHNIAQLIYDEAFKHHSPTAVGMGLDDRVSKEMDFADKYPPEGGGTYHHRVPERRPI